MGTVVDSRPLLSAALRVMTSTPTLLSQSARCMASGRTHPWAPIARVAEASLRGGWVHDGGADSKGRRVVVLLWQLISATSERAYWIAADLDRAQHPPLFILILLRLLGSRLL
jgi:hypothetical protein